VPDTPGTAISHRPPDALAVSSHLVASRSFEKGQFHPWAHPLRYFRFTLIMAADKLNGRQSGG